MKWDVNTKEKIQYITAIVLTVFGAGLILAGFIINPTGEIHSSVITSFGVILTFVGAIYGINLHYENELTKIKRTVSNKTDSNR